MKKRLGHCEAQVAISNNSYYGKDYKLYTLQSYNSPVCEINVFDYQSDDFPVKVVFFPRFDYSRTTREHIRKFLKEYINYEFDLRHVRQLAEEYELGDLYEDVDYNNDGEKVLISYEWHDFRELVRQFDEQAYCDCERYCYIVK